MQTTIRGRKFVRFYTANLNNPNATFAVLQDVWDSIAELEKLGYTVTRVAGTKIKVVQPDNSITIIFDDLKEYLHWVDGVLCTHEFRDKHEKIEKQNVNQCKLVSITTEAELNQFVKTHPGFLKQEYINKLTQLFQNQKSQENLKQEKPTLRECDEKLAFNKGQIKGINETIDLICTMLIKDGVITLTSPEYMRIQSLKVN